MISISSLRKIIGLKIDVEILYAIARRKANIHPHFGTEGRFRVQYTVYREQDRSDARC